MPSHSGKALTQGGKMIELNFWKNFINTLFKMCVDKNDLLYVCDFLERLLCAIFPVADDTYREWSSCQSALECAYVVHFKKIYTM